MAPNDLFGVFSEAGSLAVGDQYDPGPKSSKPKKCLRPFLVQTPKTGRNPDAYLDHTVRSLAQGDRYTDAWLLERRQNKGSGKPVSTKAFLALVAPRCSVSCGLGSNDGCLTEVPCDTDSSAAVLRSSPPKRPADKRRNFYTSAPKRGGFGMPWKDRSIGTMPVHYSDGFEMGRVKEKEMRAAMAKCKPFYMGSTAPPQPGTSRLPDSGSGCGGNAQGQATSTAESNGTRGGARDGKRPVWRTGGPPKQGAAYCTFSNVGRDYVPEPVAQARQRAATAPAVVQAQAARSPFRPPSVSKARLSMWAPNPYFIAARPAPDTDFTLF